MQKGTRIVSRLAARVRRYLVPVLRPAVTGTVPPGAGDGAGGSGLGAADDEDAPLVRVDHPALSRSGSRRDPLPVVGMSLDVDGWACGKDPIAAVEVLVDGRPLARASHGYVRRDVRRAHPQLSGAGKSGFRALADLSAHAEGEHEIEVRACTALGRSSSVIGRVVVSSTPPPAEVPGVPDWDGQYARVRKRARVAPEQILAAAAMDRRFRVRPRFGLVVVARDHVPTLLAETLESIRGQSYPWHETVLVDDGSEDPAVREVLAGAARQGGGIRLIHNPEPQGMAPALAAGLAALDTDFVIFVTAEDLLAPLALHSLARRINERPQADVLYADADHVSPEGKRHRPEFKPDWSPHLLLSTDYLRGLVAFRRQLVIAAGGIDVSLPGAHAHDLALRVTERAAGIEHLPGVLYSTRLGQDESPADRIPFARAGSREAIERALARRGIAGAVETTGSDGVFRVRRAIPDQPLVSILIPTAATQHVGRCVRSILERTRYANFEILVLDTSCGDAAVRSLLAGLAALDPRVRVCEDARRPFSFAASNNRGAEMSAGAYLLALNDDTEVLDPDWLGAMVGAGLDPRAGVVGARLFYPSGRIQHAGVVLGIGEIAGHAFRHFPADHPGYLRLAVCEREVGAATFACALVRREVWELLGGLDEVNLPLSYNDVDFCLRVRAAGYDILYAPDARLLHFESATRGGSDASIGHVYIRRRWRSELARDPYYNPNLSLAGEDFGLDLDDDE